MWISPFPELQTPTDDFNKLQMNQEPSVVQRFSDDLTFRMLKLVFVFLFVSIMQHDQPRKEKRRVHILAAEVEGVEGRSRASQDVDGGRRRTRHQEINVGKAGRLETMTSVGADMESGSVTSAEHVGIQPLSWRTRSREKFHTAWKTSPHHSGDTCVHSASELPPLFEAAPEPVAPSPSVSLLLLYTSLTHSIVNHGRRQLNYSKVTEVQASYPFCYQQLLSQRQEEQVRLLGCWQAGQRWEEATWNVQRGEEKSQC